MSQPSRRVDTSPYPPAMIPNHQSPKSDAAIAGKRSRRLCLHIEGNARSSRGRAALLPRAVSPSEDQLRSRLVTLLPAKKVLSNDSARTDSVSKIAGPKECLRRARLFEVIPGCSPKTTRKSKVTRLKQKTAA